MAIKSPQRPNSNAKFLGDETKSETSKLLFGCVTSNLRNCPRAKVKKKKQLRCACTCVHTLGLQQGNVTGFGIHQSPSNWEEAKSCRPFLSISEASNQPRNMEDSQSGENMAPLKTHLKSSLKTRAQFVREACQEALRQDCFWQLPAAVEYMGQ